MMKMFGLIGGDVSGSISSVVHQANFRSLGIDAGYVGISAETWHKARRRVEKWERMDGSFAGMSVTAPFKVKALEWLGEERVDEVSRKIGAVNTLVRGPDGKFRGFNTDWLGFALSADQQGPGLLGRRVLVIGAGGAGAAAAYGAIRFGAARVDVLSRVKARAAKLAARIGAPCFPVGRREAFAASEKADFIVNASGIQGAVVNLIPRNRGQCLNCFGKVLFDLRYYFGGVSGGIDGRQMLVFQAAEQFKLWFPGKVPDVRQMSVAAAEALGYAKYVEVGLASCATHWSCEPSAERPELVS